MEIWDIYDSEGNLTGRTIPRGDTLKEGDYHLVVHIWFVNSKGQVLIQKRPDNLKYAPGVWAITGGSALQGEDSLTAAIRETKEELGLDVVPDIGPIRHKRPSSFTDIWIVKRDIDINDITMQEEEVEAIMWVYPKELQDMIKNGSFHRYSELYFEKVSKYINLF